MVDSIRCTKCQSIDVTYRKKRGSYICEDCNTEFYVDIKEKSSKKRIFISYGHDQYIEIAEKLKVDLMARSHEVWFDKERIRSGVDWENYIDEGLEWVASKPKEGYLLLLMTPHSVRRPDGYCLNEVARAISKSIPIIPIMLVWSEPPLSICRIQWLDMTKCIPISEKQDQYESFFNQLTEVIELDTIEIEGFQSRLIRLLKPLSFDADISRHIFKFLGRRWIFEKIDNWLNEVNVSRVFWITGKPGVGKTAISSWICFKRPEIIALHLCRYGHAQKSDPRRIIVSMAYQLSTQLKDYENQLKMIDLNTNINESNAKTLFDILITQPLYKIRRNSDKPLVILIDALDEATIDGKNELAAFIASEFERTPNWLRLIVTSRPDSEIRYSLQGFTPFILDASTPENEEDIRKYLYNELRNYKIESYRLQFIIDEIFKRSEGIFLYVIWVLKELEERRLSIDRIEDFPQGLGGVYAQFFVRQFPNKEKYKLEVRPILEILTAAQEPLEKKLIDSIFNWDEYRQEDFYKVVGSLFNRDGDKIRSFHLSIIDWLTDSNRADCYFVSKIRGHKCLGEYGWQKYNDGVKSMDHYVITHLLTHLIKIKSWEKIEIILTDLEFVERKCILGQVHELLEDYNMALSLSSNFENNGEKIRAFAYFIKSKCHILMRCPHLLLQQALNEPDSTLPAKFAQDIKNGNLIQNTWMAWVNKLQYIDICLATFIGHTRSVEDIAISSDGSKIVSASYDNTLKVWETETGKELITLTGHNDLVEACTFSLDGKLIVSAARDKSLRIWDAKTGLEIQKLIGHKNDVTDCVFFLDGKRLISNSRDSTLRIWNIETGIELINFSKHSNWISDFYVSANESKIVTSSFDYTLRIWDVNSGRELKVLCGHTNPVIACAFSPDGQKIVSASRDKTLIIWDAMTGNRLVQLFGHTQEVNSCEFFGDGKSVVSASNDGLIKIWDINTGAELKTLAGHSRGIISCKLSPHGNKILSSSWDRTMKLWDANTGEEIVTLVGHTDSISKCKFSSDGNRIISCSRDKTIKLWRTDIDVNLEQHNNWRTFDKIINVSKDGSKFIAQYQKKIKLYDTVHSNELAELSTLKDPINTGKNIFSLSLDGSRVVSNSFNFSMKVWDIRNGQEITTLEGHEDNIMDCTFSPDGTKIISASEDNTVRIWDAMTGIELYKLRHTDAVLACKISFDGNRIISASEDKTLKLWSVETGKELATFKEHTDYVVDCDFSPNGNEAVSASRDNTLIIWDVNMKRQPIKLIGHNAWINTCKFSPDGNVVISASSDKTLRIWNANTGIELAKLEGHNSSVYDFAISPNGKIIASTSWDGTVRVWDIYKGIELSKVSGVNSYISDIMFSPDGTKIAISCHDYSIKVLEIDDSIEMTTLSGHSSSVSGCAFSPNGDKFISIANDNTLKIWKIETFTMEKSFPIYKQFKRISRIGSVSKKLLFSDQYNVLKLWELVNGKIIFSLNGHSGEVTWCEFSRDEMQVLSASTDCTLKLWDTTLGTELFSLKSHNDTVTACRFSPDGATILSASSDCTMKIWNRNDGTLIKTLYGHSSPIMICGFSPNGKWILSASSDNKVKLWDSKTGEEKLTFEFDIQYFDNERFWEKPSWKFSQSNQFIIYLSNYNTLRCYDIENGKELECFKINTPFRKHMLASEIYKTFDISPNGNQMVYATEDHKIIIWDMEKRKEKVVFMGHEDEVYCCIFSSNGLWIASVSKDNTVKVWDVVNGDIICESWIEVAGGINSLVWSEDSKNIIISTINSIYSFELRN